jgi:hypothetical protein
VGYPKAKRAKKAQAVLNKFNKIIKQIITFKKPFFTLVNLNRIRWSISPDYTIGNKNGIWIENGILDGLITVVLIISGIIHSFSKEKMEDEYISSIRLQALTWSIYVNYSLVLIATLTIFGIDYLHVMIIHLFSLIILFNIRFQLKLRTSDTCGTAEE